MPTVQSVLDHKGRDVATIPADATVLDAARLMNERHIGALVVTEADRVVGVFTERDILTRVVGAECDPATTFVSDVMTTPVAVCSPETTRDECRNVMRSRRIRHLPVVASDRLVGIVSIGDLLVEESSDQEQTIRYLYEYMHGGFELQPTH